MDIGALRLVQAVAETGGVSRAAETLNCVQSNVTARLRRLEEELGVTLFSRSARGMAPTPAGRVLTDYAARLLALLDEASRAVRAVGADAGPLALGSMETTAAVRLPAALARYHQIYPEVDLTLSTGATEQLVDAVLARRLDAALIGGPVAHPELIGDTVFVEELVAVYGPGPAKFTLLGFRAGCTYRARAERWAREIGRLPLRVMEFGTLDGVLGCVAAGMGCAVLPRSVVTQAHYAGRFRIEALAPELAHAPTVLIRRADAPANPRLDRFAEILAQSQAEAEAETARPSTRLGAHVEGS